MARQCSCCSASDHPPNGRRVQNSRTFSGVVPTTSGSGFDARAPCWHRAQLRTSYGLIYRPPRDSRSPARKWLSARSRTPRLAHSSASRHRGCGFDPQTRNRSEKMAICRAIPIATILNLYSTCLQNRLFAGKAGEAGATGLEPATSAVTGQRSNLLSYAPAIARSAGATFRAPPVWQGWRKIPAPPKLASRPVFRLGLLGGARRTSSPAELEAVFGAPGRPP
jgi:hypothetical protein